MKAKLTLLATPGRGNRIELDGIDVTGGVRALDLQAGVGEVTRLTLDVMLREGATVEGDFEVRVPDATAETLKALGWTPPEGN